MNRPHGAEPQANFELARALKRRNPYWTDETVHAERTQVLQSGPTKKPDILIALPRHQPVIIETEFAPARTVEQDATARLGDRLTSTGAEIEGALSVVLPEGCRTGSLEAIDGVAFRYAAHYLNSKGNPTRWPEREWLEGGVDDLADVIEFLSISERQLARGTESLEAVVRHVSGLLAEYAGAKALKQIADRLHQKESEQTQRMAAAIFVSAFVFHVSIERQEHVPPVPMAGSIDKITLLRTWTGILEVTCWPIFSIAHALVLDLPVKAVPPIMNRIAESVSELAEMGATTYHDLAGRMFQTLIADRKFLATFYTLPESACLLAELAVARLNVDWSNRDEIERLRIADFACGTGALLSAAQRSVYRRYRRTGGDDKDLHRASMERVFIGWDILPSATHLTCSMLSSAHPSLAYGSTQIHTLPYGRSGGRTHIGSLDFLEAAHSYSLFPVGETLGGIASSNTHSVGMEDESCDLIIMNPPFTRPTNHEATHRDVPVPSFAGFAKSLDEQKAMSGVLKKTTGAFGSGNAGLASNFMDLGHRKLKRGGVLALVIPLTFARGQSWEKARKELHAHYSDVQVISIASTGAAARAFSADTHMAECLVVATKTPGGRASYLNLAARPTTFLESSMLAKNAPSRSVPGDILNASPAGVAEPDLSKFMRSLERGEVWATRKNKITNIPVTTLGELGHRGPLSRDLTGPPPRGAFDKKSLRAGRVPTYPGLWAHHAQRERRFLVEADCELRARKGYEDDAAGVWERSASRLHLAIDFRLNSQSLAACLTAEKTLGGRAWPSFVLEDEAHEGAVLLWLNSTLGLMSYWWKGSRQQLGRTVVSISSLEFLPVVDPRRFDKRTQREIAHVFKRFQDAEFLPAHESHLDANRKALDEALLAQVLGSPPTAVDDFDVVRRQWCSEPSVHGGKSSQSR